MIRSSIYSGDKSQFINWKMNSPSLLNVYKARVSFWYKAEKSVQMLDGKSFGI